MPATVLRPVLEFRHVAQRSIQIGPKILDGLDTHAQPQQCRRQVLLPWNAGPRECRFRQRHNDNPREIGLRAIRRPRRLHTANAVTFCDSLLAGSPSIQISRLIAQSVGARAFS